MLNTFACLPSAKFTVTHPIPPLPYPFDQSVTGIVFVPFLHTDVRILSFCHSHFFVAFHILADGDTG